MYVVTAGSSRTGSIVARLLLEAGRKVRVVVRDGKLASLWKERGAEIAIADYRDLPALTAAFQGAEAAYVIPPTLPVQASGHHEYRALATEGIARAFDDARVPYAVALSSFGAQHAEGTGMIRSCFVAERLLRGLRATSVTLLRPAFFLENWMAQLPAVRDGMLPSFLGPVDRKFPMVGTVDIGAVATRLLLEPAPSHRIVELAGAADYSVADVAATFARLLGRPVKPMIQPAQGMAKYLESVGFSPETAANYEELFAAMMTGHVAHEGKAPIERGSYGLAYTLGRMLRGA